MKAAATLVYVGPTLRADEVRALLPDATVMPPAAVGDVLRAVRRRGIGRIAIIDGYFERMAAVWHKEILLALARGIEVWGAASMGALRAAELAAYGMRGVGTIYRDYAAGRLTADDEVAVVHAPAEYGYAPLSDALVNIRSGLARARWLDAATRAQLVDLARRRFYRERTWAQLFADARAAGLDATMLARLEASPKSDRKAADARLLLRTMRTTRRRAPAKIHVPRTWALRQLLALR